MNRLSRKTLAALSGSALIASAATALLAAPNSPIVTSLSNAVSNVVSNAVTNVANGVANVANTSTRVTTNAAISNIATAPAKLTTPRATNVAWTTYKGNAQRTGASNVRIALPLGLEWRYSSEADPGPIVGSPLIVTTARGRSVLFNAGRNIFALDGDSGELLWAADSVSTLRAPLTLLPQTSGALVLMTASNGTVQAIRATDGRKVWTYKSSSPIAVAPVLVNTAKGARIVLAPSNGVLVALTTAGVLDSSWRVTLGQGTMPAATPSLNKTGDRLLVTGRDGYLYIIDIRNARVAQAVNIAGDSPMSAIDTGSVIVTGAGSNALGIRADNNSVVWRTSVGEENILSVSLGGDGTAYFVTNRGTVLALRSRDGQQIWKTSVGRTSLSGSPLILPNMILVGGRDSILYAVDRATGKVTWRYRVDTERSVPVAAKVSASPTPQVSNPYGNNPYANPFGGVPTNSGTGTATGIRTVSPTPTPVQEYERRTYGLSSAPAIVDGQLLVAADNAAVYSFATSFFDGAPPSVADTKIVVPTVEGGEFPVVLSRDLPGVPLKGPIYVDVQLKDEGSGIDASRIRTVFDGRVIDASDTKYDASSGVLRVAVQKYRRGADNEITEGQHVLVVEASDYSGNTMRSSHNFNASKTFQSPSVPRIAVTATPTPIPALRPPSWRDRWDPRNGTPPWANRGGGRGNQSQPNMPR